MRKLLPYEHQLIEALGVTKEEYLNFLVAQEEYVDPKIGTALDIRNGPSPDPVTISIILTVVGILFQVGAALLAPKPEIPDASRRSRQKRFAPSFGFNSAQDLAKYGDPVNLVYTNNDDNAKGNVRVNGSLLWSSIDSFGSSQFMRLTVALGASQIEQIDYTRTAFGQLAFSDLDRKSIYVFEGLDKPAKFSDGVSGFAGTTRYPELLKSAEPDVDLAFLCLNRDLESSATTRVGYSQAYTPSSFTSLGVYDSIPINVRVTSRNKKGKTEKHDIGIELKKDTADNNLWIENASNSSGVKGFFEEDSKIVLYFDDTTEKRDDDVPRKTAENLRHQTLEALDFSSTYILGAAKFRLHSYLGEDRILTEDNSVRAKFVCVEGGKAPATPYTTKTPLVFKDEKIYFKVSGIGVTVPVEDSTISEENLEIIEGKFQEALDILTGDEEEVRGLTAKAGSFNIDFSDPVSNGEITPSLRVAWKPEYVATVDLDFNIKNGSDTDKTNQLTRRVENFPKAGSIKYTQDVRDQVGADEPVNAQGQLIDLTITTKEIRKKARKQKKALVRLVEDIKAGVFDGADTDIINRSFSYIERIDSYNNDRGKVVPFKNFRFDFPLNNQTCLAVGLDENGNSLIDNLLARNGFGPTDNRRIREKRFFKGVEEAKFENRTGERVSHYYTFAYIDSQETVNLFNFTGVQGTTSTDVFPEDDKLQAKRNRLAKVQQEKQDVRKNSKTRLDEVNTRVKEDALTSSSVAQNKSRQLLNRDTNFENAKFEDFKSEQLAEDKDNARVAKRIETLLNRRRADAINIIEADIDLIDEFLDQVPDDLQITDRVGTRAIRSALKDLNRQKKQAKIDLEFVLDDWPNNFLNSIDNDFFTKCLTKAESATYNTISACDAVIFSLKTKLFRRITGRQKEYGDRKVDGYSESDNGVKSRMAFFRMFYRQSKTDRTDWNEIPYMFVVRHGSEAEFYTQIIFYSQLQTEWEFKFDPVFDVRAEYETRPFNSYFFLENTDKSKTVQIDNTLDYINFVGRKVNRGGDSLSYYPTEKERGPYLTNEWDMFSVNSDTQVAFSFESGPEIALTAVTEQQLDLDYVSKYKKMQTMSLGVFAGRNIQDLRSISTMVQKGKLCRTVEKPNKTPPTKSSSYAPDIFVDTLLDEDNGVGKYITSENIDFDSLKLAKAFCVNNKLFMDGVIADPGSWREFWVNAAPFSLLELARKNGKDTLVPAIPIDECGEFSDPNGLPVNVNISALFTTGNILQGSYKEEFLNATDSTENLIASVIYRDSTSAKTFTTNKSVNVRLLENDTSSANDDQNTRETFDVSQFVTNRSQAIMFGKLLCNQRRYVKKGIEFRTLPSEAGLEPGAFIYVDVGIKDWDHYSSGIIMKGGALNSPLAGNSVSRQDAETTGKNFNFLLYKPLTGEVESETASVVTTNKGISTASALSGYEGWMFVMGSEKPNKRVFRVTELSIEEEGELSVKAVEYPCFEESGGTRAHIADFRSSKFEVS